MVEHASGSADDDVWAAPKFGLLRAQILGAARDERSHDGRVAELAQSRRHRMALTPRNELKYTVTAASYEFWIHQKSSVLKLGKKKN